MPHCSLRDNFRSNVTVFNAYKWRHRHCCWNLELNYLQNTYFRFFIYEKLAQWRCFVTYLSNDPRKQHSNANLSRNMHKKTKQTYQFLFLNELDISKSFGGKFNCLVKAIFTAVRHIDDLNHFRLQPLQHTYTQCRVITKNNNKGKGKGSQFV